MNFYFLSTQLIDQQALLQQREARCTHHSRNAIGAWNHGRLVHNIWWDTLGIDNLLGLWAEVMLEIVYKLSSYLPCPSNVDWHVLIGWPWSQSTPSSLVIRVFGSLDGNFESNGGMRALLPLGSYGRVRLRPVNLVLLMLGR